MLRLGVQPLQITFKWIRFAFVGFLPLDQVLVLWDRIIACDSGLLLLPTMAAAIVVFRSQSILACTSEAELR